MSRSAVYLFIHLFHDTAVRSRVSRSRSPVTPPSTSRPGMYTHRPSLFRERYRHTGMLESLNQGKLRSASNCVPGRREGFPPVAECVIPDTGVERWIRGWSGGMPRSLISWRFFRLPPGRRRRWLSLVMPGSARPRCGDTCLGPLRARPGYCRASRPLQKDRWLSRRLMTCSGVVPGKSFQRSRVPRDEPWRPCFSVTSPRKPCRLHPCRMVIRLPSGGHWRAGSSMRYGSFQAVHRWS